MINLKNKRILVTGGTGFIGQQVVHDLIQKYNVPKKNVFIPLLENYDLRKWENCLEIMKNQDIVIHLAAVTGSIEFHRLHPGKIFYDNIIMGVQLMEAARQAGTEKFVAIGSATEYPEITSIPFKEEKLWNGCPEEIHVPYSFAKKMLLVQSQAYRREYNFNAIHLLLTNVFGPGMNLESGYVIFSLIKKIDDAKKSRKKFIEVWGTGKPTRDFLYIEDAAEGILLAAERYDGVDPVNLGSGRGISIKNLVKTLCCLMDFQGEIRWDFSKPDGQLRRILDISHAKKEFGFKVKTTIEEGLYKTIEWYKRLENKIHYGE